MADNKDIITPQDSHSSAASKGLGHLVGTLAMFAGVHFAGTAAFRGGKSKMFKLLSRSSNSVFRNAAKFATSAKGEGSLTAYLSKTDLGSALGADRLWKARSSKVLNEFYRTNKSKNIIQKYKSLKSLSKTKRTNVMKGMSANYIREAAVSYPLFYAAESSMGLREKEGKPGPSWYNIPGHALEFAKFVPEMALIDLGARSVFGLAKAGIDYAGPKLASIIPEGVQNALVKATAWLQEGRYADIELAPGINTGDVLDKTKAFTSAWYRTIGSATREKLQIKSADTLLKYRSTGIRPKQDWFDSIKTRIDSNYKQEYTLKRKQRKLAQKATRMGLSAADYVRHNFDDAFSFLGNDKGLGTSRYQAAMQMSNVVDGRQEVYKTFYGEAGKTPFISRFLGLTRARGKDFVRDRKDNELSSIYKQLKTSQSGGEQGKLLFETSPGKQISETDFVDTIIAAGDKFIHKSTNKIIDIDKLRPGYWMDKFIRKLPTVAGFHIADLSPIKVFTARKAPRAVTLEGTMAIHPKYQTEAFKSGRFRLEDESGGTVIYNNLYQFVGRGTGGPSGKGVKGYGMALRGSNEKLYNIWDAQHGQWQAIGKNVKLSLKYDSIKQSRVYYNQMASDTTQSGIQNLEATYSNSPAIRFMQERLDLFKNKPGKGMSLFDYGKMYLPKSISKAVFESPAASTARDVIKNMSKYSTNTNFKSTLNTLQPYQAKEFIKEAGEFIQLGNKVSQRTYDKLFSDDAFFKETLNFLKLDKKLSIGKPEEIIGNIDAIINLAKQVRKTKASFFGIPAQRNKKAVESLLDEIQVIKKDAITRRSGGAVPVTRLKRYLHDYARSFSQDTKSMSISRGVPFESIEAARRESIKKLAGTSKNISATDEAVAAAKKKQELQNIKKKSEDTTHTDLDTRKKSKKKNLEQLKKDADQNIEGKTLEELRAERTKLRAELTDEVKRTKAKKAELEEFMQVSKKQTAGKSSKKLRAERAKLKAELTNEVERTKTKRAEFKAAKAEVEKQTTLDAEILKTKTNKNRSSSRNVAEDKIMDGQSYEDMLYNKIEKLYKAGRLSEKQVAEAEFTMLSERLQTGLKAEQRVGKDTSIGDEALEFLDVLREGSTRTSIVGKNRTVLGEFHRQTNYFSHPLTSASYDVDYIANAVNTISSEWVAYPSSAVDWFVGNLKSPGGLVGEWVGATVNRLMTYSGLGWDRTKYTTAGEVLGLWGKRFAATGAASLAYNAVDTFTDVSGLFDWSPLDEGVTVALADQATRLRLSSGFIYDALGVDNVSRYMEGLMPGSSKFVPGAAMGLMIGGLPGAAIGGAVQSYLQPQLSEGPLGFLAALPPLAPFVTDMTKTYEELQDIYEGSELVPYRKGAGWTLGNTPMEGGKIEQFVPHWYPRLKSQYKAGPELYGSKFEQFLARDLPFVDVSLMDIVDPQYLTWKQYEDRPYVIPDTIFSETPIFGPVLGPTVGRVWNFLHPLGNTAAMHEKEASNNFYKGKNFDWKGAPSNTIGPQYAGAKMFDIDTGGFQMPGQNPNQLSLHSPFHAKPALSELIYKDWIELFGLPGFVTSAVLWGGDEPFTDLPITPSAQDMDSTGRAFWEQNLGDMALSNELFRRFYPRPRTSFETVDLVKNTMPSWLPDNLQFGDPYCLLPNTKVETMYGLKNAINIKSGELVRTDRGRYMPVYKVVTRPVEEEIYTIKVKGLEELPIQVTGGHPFYINNEWILAKDIQEGDYSSYPLLNITLPNTYTDDDFKLDITTQTSHYLGLLSRWIIIDKNNYKFREEIPSEEKAEIYYYSDKLNKSIGSMIPIVQRLQEQGPLLRQGTADVTTLVSYIKSFIVPDTTSTIQFRFHTTAAAYRIWSLLLQHEIFSKIEETKVVLERESATHLNFLMNNLANSFSTTHLAEPWYKKSTTRTSSTALLEIVSVEKQYYKGLVYTIEVENDSTYCVPGALVHNSKIAFGELLLPGTAYEDMFNPNISFPVGMSRLGQPAYEQALGMIGLSNISERDEEIMDKGTAIHQMVQNQLTEAGVATRIEALVSEPREHIRSYVDVMIKDSQGKEMPLEIKSISAEGFANLNSPKWAHRIQLNAYLAVMGANQGKFLYVSRENPGMTKDFTVRFNPDMWRQTLSTLKEARGMALDFLEQGYGDPSHGYSYLDRMRVLMNAAPYSDEFRENEKLIRQVDDDGLLTTIEQDKLSKLKQHHTAMMRKYEMFPRRFKYDQIFDPEDTYNNLSLNTNIKPASDYSLAERVVGAAWESFTHMKSPIHTKLIGHYSPEEQYERKVLYGIPFQSWASPIDSFIKPYARGLRSVEDPVQGIMSWSTGGALLGGLPGAVAGGIFGGAYGTAHGMYRSIFGGKWQPDSFTDKAELAEYFDDLEYQRNMRLYEATGDVYYLKQAQRTNKGLLEFGGEISSAPGKEGIYMTSLADRTSRMYAHKFDLPEWAKQDETQNKNDASVIDTAISNFIKKTQAPLHEYNFRAAGRAANNPYMHGTGTDKGFGSPWKGTDFNSSKDYDTAFHSAMSSLPSWDKPFFSALVQTEEDRRDDVLLSVDKMMANVLRKTWGRPEEINMTNVSTYFKQYSEPSILNPIMDPTANTDDIEAVTIGNEGLDMHDFGMGWREQMRRINNSPTPIVPLDINAGSTRRTDPTGISGTELEKSIRSILNRMGYGGASVLIRSSPSAMNSTDVTVNIKRSAASDIIRGIKNER